MPGAEAAADRMRWLPLAAVSATIVTWGLASPLVKSSTLSGPALGFYRTWIGVAILFAVLGAAKQPLTKQTLKWGGIAGAIFGANMLFFLVSIKLTTVANATLIGALQPAIVLVVAGPLFGERVTRREIGCVALAIAGVAIVIVGSAGAPEWNPVGDLLAMFAVLTFTAYFLISKQARSYVGTLEYMAVVHLAAALAMTPLALADPQELVSFTWKDVFIVAFFALVSGTAGQVVIGWAHRYVDVTLSSLMMLGVPVVAAAAAWLMLDETLTPLQMLGGAVTLVGIGLMLRRPPAVTEGWEEVGVPAGAAPSTPKPAR